jgi:GNAT superfamily N-acetyltransferase
MQETTLGALDLAEIGAAFTTIYTGYSRPFVMDAAAAEQHLTRYDIDRLHSPLWLDDAGAVMALAALGVRGDQGWVGGFGVAPAYRGQGLSHRLMAEMIALGGALGLRDLWLEVITTNAPAIRTYRRARFTPVRDLRIFASPSPAAVDSHNAAVIHDADPANLLNRSAQITAIRPVWQRAPQSFAHVSEISGLALGDGDEPEAYVIYRAGPTAIWLADIAAPDAAAATVLVGAVAARYPDRTLSLGNEPEESPACTALDTLGWTETLRQHEMVYRYA